MTVGEANSIDRRIAPRKTKTVPFSVATNGTFSLAPNTDLDRLEPNYLKDGEARPLRACLIVCYGNKCMVMRHGAMSADAVSPNEVKVSWK